MLFKCVGPFEPALRRRGRNGAVAKNALDTDGMVARMIELEKCLTSTFGSILLLNGWEHKKGKSASLRHLCALHKR